jgi:hypothetical protein
MLIQPDIHAEKINIKFHVVLHGKKSLKWIINLNIKDKTKISGRKQRIKPS